MGSAINLVSLFGDAIPAEDQRFHSISVADLLHRQNLTFPGAQPVSFARHHLQELQRRDYFMCEKTDGIRCLLFLTHLTIEGGEELEAQFMIDRKNDYYYVPRDALHMPTREDVAAFQRRTLLDGELVWQRLPNGKERLAYLIFDCLAVEGQVIMNRPFDVRLGKIGSLVWEPYKAFTKKYPQDVANQPFQIEMKKMEFSYAMEMMFKEKIPKLPHGNDGLIFTCKETPYVAGTDQHILKWKPPHENTIDFRLLVGDFPTGEDEQGPYEDFNAKPEMELHINHGREGYKYFANLTVADAEWDAMKRLNQQLDGRIIECFRDPSITDSDVWRPKVEHDGSPRFRDDKRDANHASVVESVVESIRDAVTEQDLLSAAPGIRSAFKARAGRKANPEERRKLPVAAKPAVEDDGPVYD